MAEKYTFKEGDAIGDKPIGERTRVFLLLKPGQQDWQGVSVWWSEGLGHANCCECSTPLVAMSRSCVHAKALKRHMEREDGHGVVPAKCDGNHGGPPCGDPECWALPEDRRPAHQRVPNSGKPARAAQPLQATSHPYPTLLATSIMVEHHLTHNGKVPPATLREFRAAIKLAQSSPPGGEPPKNKANGGGMLPGESKDQSNA